MSKLTEYAFEVELITVIRVKAISEEEARRKIREHFDCADANFGQWDDSGDPIVAECSINHTEDENDAMRLFEVDEVEVD